MSRKPRFEALVVNAIRRLQAAQGSTASEIASYLSQEYDVGGPEVRKQIQQTIRRGVNYGILQKSKRGYTTCDRNIPEPLEPLDVADCNTCKRSSRRSRRSRSSKRGRKGKKSRGRRMSCRSGCGSRRRGHSTARKARMGRQKKQKMASSDKPKMKKNPSGEESTASRQASRTRTSSKSPMRRDDENQES